MAGGRKAPQHRESGRFSFFVSQYGLNAFLLFFDWGQRLQGATAFLIPAAGTSLRHAIKQLQCGASTGEKRCCSSSTADVRGTIHKKSYGRRYVEILVQLQNEASCSTHALVSPMFTCTSTQKVRSPKHKQCNARVGPSDKARVCLHPFSHATVTRTQR